MYVQISAALYTLLVRQHIVQHSHEKKMLFRKMPKHNQQQYSEIPKKNAS